MENRSLAQQNWKQGKCRIEDGIFFGDDRVILFDDKEQSIKTLDQLVETKPGFWTELDIAAEYQSREYGVQVFAGGGSWEGEGFVAVSQLEDEQLLWLIHLSDSEAFISVKIQDDNIYAVSQEYPSHWEWIIPIYHPQKLKKIS